MSKAIFDTRSGTIYDDEIGTRYHFPNRYLAAAEATVGDWIVYREPRRGGGREGYVAVARVVRIELDPNDLDRSYAYLAEYLPFDNVVPLRSESGFYEASLNVVPSPALIGSALQGRSVRQISDFEFALIVQEGLCRTLDPENATRLGLDDRDIAQEIKEIIQTPGADQLRRIEQILMNRKVRDAAFRRAVCDAYDNQCAFTGLRMVNGGGRAEVQAAHIIPVADGGVDVVQNGIALSGTVHWLFDRHLISLTDDFAMLVAHNRIPAELRGLFDRQMRRIILPRDQNLHPHRDYVRRHREKFAGE